MSKYEPFATFLRTLPLSHVNLTFEDIEQALGSSLPPVARTAAAFWANSKTNDSHYWSHLWQAAGWETNSVNLKQKTIGFRRTGQSPFSLAPKQLRILGFLGDRNAEWSTRHEMELSTGKKGFSFALGAPTQGNLRDGSLEHLGLIERADDHEPFRYRISAKGRLVLNANSAVKSTGPTFALVLTQNEVYAGEDFGWEDQTGVQYEFPSKYRSLIKPGTPFVYYRGRRRANGKSAAPDYFGHGVIGAVNPSLDQPAEKAPRRWTAAIQSWSPFLSTVRAQSEDGTYVEAGDRQLPGNYWRDGVRPIHFAQYCEILSLADASPISAQTTDKLIELSGELKPAESSLIKAKLPSKGTSSSPGLNVQPRRSKNSTVIGRAAEKLFYNHLRSESPGHLHEKIRWLASLGETPGYDIQDDRDPEGITAYEVKGTTSSHFSAIIMTSNEIACAHKLANAYAVVLVSGVGTPTPRFQIARNPSQWILANQARVEPTAFALTLTDDFAVATG